MSKLEQEHFALRVSKWHWSLTLTSKQINNGVINCVWCSVPDKHSSETDLINPLRSVCPSEDVVGPQQTVKPPNFMFSCFFMILLMQTLMLGWWLQINTFHSIRSNPCSNQITKQIAPIKIRMKIIYDVEVEYHHPQGKWCEKYWNAVERSHTEKRQTWSTEQGLIIKSKKSSALTKGSVLKVIELHKCLMETTYQGGYSKKWASIFYGHKDWSLGK